MDVEQFTVRPAGPADDQAIAALVVAGFLDQFRPVFGARMDRALPIMEGWVKLEHASGGTRSLLIEGDAPGKIAASIGVRTGASREDVLARGLWDTLCVNLGFLRALWATTLLSHPRYVSRPSEMYIERLVVAPDYRRRGMARSLLHAANSLGREAGKRTAGLHVSENNVAALRLYEGEGYSEVSRQRSLLTRHFLGVRSWIYLQKEI